MSQQENHGNPAKQNQPKKRNEYDKISVGGWCGRCTNRQAMSYALSLRVIGQILEASRVATFKLQKNDEPYRISIGKNLFRLDPADIARLDALAQKKRRNFSGMAARPPNSLSQHLRALGGLLDRIDIRSFRIVWTGDSTILEYEQVNRQRNRRVFTPEELWQLTQHGSLLRSSRYLLPRLDI